MRQIHGKCHRQRLTAVSAAWESFVPLLRGSDDGTMGSASPRLEQATERAKTQHQVRMSSGRMLQQSGPEKYIRLQVQGLEWLIAISPNLQIPRACAKQSAFIPGMLQLDCLNPGPQASAAAAAVLLVRFRMCFVISRSLCHSFSELLF